MHSIQQSGGKDKEEGAKGDTSFLLRKLLNDSLPSCGVQNLVIRPCLVRRESEKFNFYSRSARLSCSFFFLVKEGEEWKEGAVLFRVCKENIVLLLS